MAQDKVNKFPLTIGQKGLWFLHQLDPLSDRYNIPLTFKFSNNVKTKDLKEVLKIFIQRHSVMRSTFHETDGLLQRSVHSSCNIKINEHDVNSINQQNILSKIRDLSGIPFNLEKGPLIRVHIFNGYQGGRILLFSVHHLIFDGASLKILCDEFELTYRFLMEGNHLDILKYDYNDFQVWQQQWLDSDDAQLSQNYWLDKLSGELPQLNLPVDNTLNKNKSIQGEVLKFSIPDVIVNRFKKLASDYKCSEYLVWLAAYFSFLSRYTSQQDIIVGTPSMGRPDAKFDDIVGYFVNLIPLRYKINPHQKFIDLLKGFKNNIYEALMHADYPLPELINVLGDANQRGDQPLFQTSFVWNVTEQLKLDSDSLLGLELYPLIHESGEQSLSVELLSSSTGIEGLLKYRSNYFAAESIGRIKDSFINFIDSIGIEPDSEIKELSLLTEADENKLLHTLNDTQVDYPSELCIHQLFEQQVEKTPNNIAIVFEEDSLSYTELNKRSNQLAHYLVKNGVKPDDILGLCIERSLEMMIGILAILKAGAAYLPLDPIHPKARLKHMINNSVLSMVLTQQKLISITEGQLQLVLDDHDFMASLAHYSVNNPRIAGLNSKHLAYVIYTSGSTGLPKGVMVEHQALVNRIDWMQKQYHLTENDVVLQKTPYSFDVSVWELSWFFTIGAKLVIAKPEGHKDPAYLSDIIQKNKVTTLHFVPSMLRVMLTNRDWSHCNSLRQVFCSGEALSSDIAELHYDLNSATLHNLYGPTEAAIDVSYWQVPNESNLTLIPIGKPIQNIQLLILNAQLQLQPQGFPGELFIGGVGLARGYLNQPELTEERFIQHPFSYNNTERLYRTGDLVRYLDDGNIEFIGRIDNQVKIRGFRIELEEIEQQLTAQPHIQSSLVVVKQQDEEIFLVAYLCTDTSIEESEFINQIRMTLENLLPDYMIPSMFVMLKGFPLTVNGKIDRKALPEPEGWQFRGEYQPPEGNVELTLVAIWSKLLKIPQAQISADANFFQLGGHSLLIAKLINEVQDKIDLQIAYIDIFNFPSLRKLSTMISDEISTNTLINSLEESRDDSVEELEW